MDIVRHFPIFLGILASLFLLSSAKSRRVKAKKIPQDQDGKSSAKCLDVSSSDSGFKLRCGSSDVIYSIVINSYNGSICDDSNGTCHGLQPSVLTDSNLCYSRRSCSIIINNKAPIVKTSNPSCIGRTPSKLRVSYRCVKRDIFLAMFKIGDNKTKVSEEKSDYGMLVSHDTYPWHYEIELMINLTIKPLSPDKTKLYLTVPVIELDFHGDVVNISDNGGTNRAINRTATDKSSLFLPSRDAMAKISFYTSSTSSTSKGFIICYYWAREEEDLLNEDICLKLKNKGRKRGGKKKKPKKDKGQKSNRKRKNKKKKRGGKKGKKRKSKKQKPPNT